MLHFISGLPRSGSTLLASLLRQNPACHASIMSPVGHIFTQTLQAMGPSNEANGFLDDGQRRDILVALVEGYYRYADRPVIFDNNRRWTANVAVLDRVFPESKIVCCLRSPAAIVDSFERLFQKNPLALSAIYDSRSNTTIYERVGSLMGQGGVVGFALNSFKGAFFGPHRTKLVCVIYDNLCQFPGRVMTELTEVLSLPAHKYDFDHIEEIPGAKSFDGDVSTPGLHDLKPKVVYENRPSVLPPDIWNSLPPAFWQVKEGETKPH